MNNLPICFLDVETAGLRNHDWPWEIAGKRTDPDGTVRLFVWHVADFRPGLADPMALQMAGFYDRHPLWAEDPERAVLNISGPDLDVPVDHRLEPASFIAARLERMTRGAIFVCCNAGFDPRVLSRFMEDCAMTNTWHYRPICATTMAASVVNYQLTLDSKAPLDLPWNNAEIGSWFGIKRDQFGMVHSALADACYAEALFLAAQNGVVPRDPREEKRTP